MLQRLLAEFVARRGVHRATMIDDRGRLLASVGSKGHLPQTEHVVHLASASLDAAHGLGLGDLHEVWFEGETTSLLDILTPYRILMLDGTNGRVARWRHTVDQMRKQLATTPEL